MSAPFVGKDWKNDPNHDTPLSAEAHEDMEARITSWAESQVTAVLANLSALEDALDAEVVARDAAIAAALAGAYTDADVKRVLAALASGEKIAWETAGGDFVELWGDRTPGGAWNSVLTDAALVNSLATNFDLDSGGAGWNYTAPPAANGRYGYRATFEQYNGAAFKTSIFAATNGPLRVVERIGPGNAPGDPHYGGPAFMSVPSGGPPQFQQLVASYDGQNNQLELHDQKRGAGDTNLAQANLPAGENSALRADRYLAIARNADNSITVEYWRGDPDFGGVKLASIDNYVLTGAQVARYGSGVSIRPGFANGTGGDTYHNDIRVYQQGPETRDLYLAVTSASGTRTVKRIYGYNGTSMRSDIVFLDTPLGGDLKGTPPAAVVDKLTDDIVDINELTQLMWKGTPNGYEDLILGTPNLLTYYRLLETGGFAKTFQPLVGGAGLTEGNINAPYTGGQPSLVSGGDSSITANDNRAGAGTPAGGVPAALQTQGSFTIEVWRIQTGAWTDSAFVWGVARGFAEGGYYLWTHSSGGYRFTRQWNNNGANGGTLTKTGLTLGTLYHLVGSYDAATNTMRFYVNGVKVAEGAGNVLGIIFDGNSKISLGETFWSPSASGGHKMDAPAIYGRTLTDTEILTHYQTGITGPTPILDAGFEHASLGVLRMRKKLQLGSLRLDAYTTALRPSPVLNPDTIIYVSDASAGQRFQYSDGANWVVPGGAPADGSITTLKIADGAVTLAKMAVNSVDGSKVVDGSLGLSELSATGTKDATTFLRGDNTFAVPAGTGGGGGGGSSAPTLFYAQNTAAVAVVANAWTKLPMDSETQDTDGVYNPATGRFQPNKPGWYEIHVRVDANVAMPASAELQVAIYKNGVDAGGVAAATGAGAALNPEVRATGSLPIYLNGTTDYIELMYYTDQAGYNLTPTWHGYSLGGGGGLAKVTSFPTSPTDGDAVIRTDLNGSPQFNYSTENGWEQVPRMGAVTVPAAQLSRNADAALAGSGQITFNTTDFDTNGMVSGANQLVCATPGLYLLEARAYMTAGGAVNMGLAISINGVAHGAKFTDAAVTSAELEVVIVRRLAAGDIVTCSNGTGSAVTSASLPNRAPKLAATWLGGAGQTVDERGVPSTRCLRSAVQSIPNGTNTLINWDLEDHDTDNIHDTLTNTSRLTVKTPGLYAIEISGEWASNANGYRRIMLLKNGVFIPGGYDVINAVNGTNSVQTSTIKLNLAAGDYIEVQVLQNSGGALDFGTGSSIQATLVGSSKTVTPFARVYKTASTQSIPDGGASSTAVSFDAEESDNDSIHDNATNNTRLTCRTAGVYLVHGMVAFQANTTGSRWLDLKKNGTTMIDERIDDPLNAGDSRDKTMDITAVVELAVGDYLELFVTMVGAGASLLLVGGANSRGCKFEMVKIGSPNAGNTGVEPLEGWHKVGAAGEPAIVAGGVTDYSGDTGWRRDRGMVQFRGEIQIPNGGLAANTLLWTQLVGFRPSTRCQISCRTNVTGSIHRGLTINPNGEVRVCDNEAWPSGGPVVINLADARYPL